MAKIELALLVGAESKQWLADLTEQLDRMEALQSKGTKAPMKSKTPAADDEEEVEVRRPKKAAPVEVDEDEDDELPVKKSAPAKGKKKVDPEDEEMGEAPDEDDEDFPAPKKKPAKKKAVSVDDVHDACKAKAASLGKAGRDAVLAILKKQFRVKSVSELEEDDYAAVIEAMAVEEDSDED